MKKFITIQCSVKTLLAMFMLFSVSASFAQKLVESGGQSAGFLFQTNADAVTPIIQYQQNIHMLSAIDDKPSVRVFGDGRVLVHWPVYMKKVGDFEMKLSDTELVVLLRDLSSNGVMDFDEKKVKAKVLANKKQRQAKGELYEVSDAMETVVNVNLDAYQKNKKSKSIKNFSKIFKWKNLEQDAAHYKDEVEITKANVAVHKIKLLMKDQRLREGRRN